MELTPPSPTSHCAPGWGAGQNRGPDAHVEKCLSGGAHSYVTGSSRSVFPASSSPSFVPSTASAAALFGSTPPSDNDDDSISITPPPAYTSIYPPSPPSSAPSSPSSGALLITKAAFANPIHKALASPSSPIKPVLTRNESSSDSSISLASLDSSLSALSLSVSAVSTSPSPLADVFPADSPVHRLPATRVELEIDDQLVAAVVENPAMGTRTLYVAGGAYENVNLRETVCTVLEKAEEDLGCTGVVMCLEKDSPDLGDLLHSLMYVGGTITTGPYTPNASYILVGLDV